MRGENNMKNNNELNNSVKISFSEIAVIVLLIASLVIAFWASNTILKSKFDFLPFVHSVSIVPKLLSTMTSIVIFCGLFLRYNKDMFSSIGRTIICALDILFMASFTSVFVGDKVGYAFLIGGVIMTWFGMRSVSGFIWIVLCICAIPRMIVINNKMGFLGALYVLLAFLAFMGEVFWIKMINFDVKNIVQDFAGVQKRVQGDMQSSIDMTKDIINTATHSNVMKSITKN